MSLKHLLIHALKCLQCVLVLAIIFPRASYGLAVSRSIFLSSKNVNVQELVVFPTDQVGVGQMYIHREPTG
jgi:hypothetical protein